MAAPEVSADLADPRIIRGMAAQFVRRRELMTAGGHRLGWKVGFGAAPARVQFGIHDPLVGFMMAEGLIKSGAKVSVSGWTKPVVEPEVAVHIGCDLSDGSSPRQVQDAVAGLGPALELADVTGRADEVEAILSGNIFHRGVILGEPDPSRSGARLDGLSGRLYRRDSEAAVVEDLERNTGRLLDIVAHVANTLAACDERLRAGDVIIAGSVTPPLIAVIQRSGLSWARPVASRYF
jgi:2-keto-4-pentenoate hydratase